MSCAIKCLTYQQVCDAFGFSRATLFRLIKRGAFPEPLRLSPGVKRFHEADLQAWLEAQRDAASASNTAAAKEG